MADIRIKDLAVTASSSASDDYLAVDGSTNGTRKLSAYSPTFGGNLTVSGGSIVNGSSTSILYFGTPSNNYLYYDGSSLFCRVGGSDRFTIPSGTGNLLIGTTTDGGQKLQVAGALAIQDYFRTTGSSSLPAAGGGNALYAGGFSSPCSGKIIIGDGSGWSFNISKRTGSTNTDLFTFADSGALSVSNSITVTGGSFASLSNGSGQIYGNTSNGLTLYGAGSVYDLILLNKAGSTVMSIPTGTINATFAGSIAIGNTVTTGVSVASTHKVQISIGGTTYYLLASNV